MKFVYRIFTLICLASLWLSLSGYIDGAAKNGRSATGAPFGNGNCGSCHSGGAYGTVSMSIQIFEVGTTTPLTSYVGGKTYTAKLSINSTTAAPFYGFQMVSVNPANAQAGTWSGFPTGVRAITLSARTYVEHSAKLTTNTQTMTWVAPTSGTGTVKFYASGDAVDGNGNESRDNAGATSLTLTEQVVTCASATLTTNSTNAACVGSATGSATVTPTGGTAPYTYAWSNGATTQTANNLTSGTYTVTVTEGGGCKTTSSLITVGANTLTAAITPSGATTFCQGKSVNLTASGGTSYAWSTGATTATLSNITNSGTYTVTVTNGTCTATTSQTITVTPPPTATISASGSTSLCAGSSVNLTASGGTSYLWSTGATTATLSNITTAGTYTVTVTSGTCTATASQIITVGGTQTATITPSGATSFCQGGSVNLTASSGTSYLWSTGAMSV
jgi:large repetitive protein